MNKCLDYLIHYFDNENHKWTLPTVQLYSFVSQKVVHNINLLGFWPPTHLNISNFWKFWSTHPPIIINVNCEQPKIFSAFKGYLTNLVSISVDMQYKCCKIIVYLFIIRISYIQSKLEYPFCTYMCVRIILSFCEIQMFWSTCTAKNGLERR